MNLIGFTINHRTASIEQRERLHFSKNEIIDIIPVLKDKFFREGFIISTCNRTEVFGFPLDGDISYKRILDFIINYKEINGLGEDNFEKYFSCGAIKHLFKVAAGLDSLLLGDSQILSQVKEAFQLSIDSNFAGSVLRRIFDSAIKVGKRSISETSIGEGAVTISFAAVQVIEKIFSTLGNKKALVIGAGETGELAAVHLMEKGVGRIDISNRTKEKGEKLAEKVSGNVIDFDRVAERLHEYDIVISATSAPHIILSKKDVKKAMKIRRGNPLCLMDIALPRDIEPTVASIENVFYHDIDSLNIIVKENLKKRENEIPKVEKIIMEEMVFFFSWFNTLNVVPVIKEFRKFFEEIRKDELEKIKHKITPADYEKVEAMTRRLVGRMIHNPTVKLRELSESGSNIDEVSEYTMVLKDMFKIGTNNEEIN